jgi:hypothetical protein
MIAPFLIMLLFVSPVLLPLTISGFHAITDWGRKGARRRTTIRWQRAAARGTA